MIGRESKEIRSFVLFMALEIKPRALCKLGKYSTAELSLQAEIICHCGREDLIVSLHEYLKNCSLYLLLSLFSLRCF